MKYITLILMTLLLSCGGKGGEGSVHVIVWKKDGKQQMTGDLSITFNTKDTKPKKSPGEYFSMVGGSGDIEDFKIGNYCITFESSEIGRCATQFRIPFETEVIIVLREGEFIHQPH